MGQIEFMDWEEWDKLSYSIENKSIYYEIGYLRDPRRVKGAGARVLQYLILPRQSQRAVAYDFYAYPGIMYLSPEPQFLSVRLIRCQKKKRVPNVNIPNTPPEFEYFQADYPVNDFMQILEDLQSIDLPHPMTHHHFFDGSDGSDYEFAYNSSKDGILTPLVTYLRYRWWEPTSELAALAQYWKQLQPKLDTFLAKPLSF